MTKRPEWRNRIVEHGEEAPDQLLANPANWRIHPKAQQDALAAVLDDVGWVQDVIVNRRTGLVVDGHLRLSLALQRGEAEIPVVYVDLSADEEALVLASIDPLSAMAERDEEALGQLLDGISAEGALAQLLDSMRPATPTEGLTDPDAVPPEPEEPYVKRGEVYALGVHRVMCGDSESEADLAQLLDGAKPRLMVTDPPYGVEYDPEWRARAGVNISTGKMGKVANDDRADWREVYKRSPASVAYVWHGALHAGEVLDGLEAARFEVRGQIIWVKDRLVLSRGHYHWRHEPCWYAVRAGQTADWIGGRKQQTVIEGHEVHPPLDELVRLWEELKVESSVWEVPSREDSGHGHGTQKPVECMARAIRNHSGDVHEPFLGSGTTLIAAERLGRRCFGMELEPKYVQVAIERWEQYTGLKAERV